MYAFRYDSFISTLFFALIAEHRALVGGADQASNPLLLQKEKSSITCDQQGDARHRVYSDEAEDDTRELSLAPATPPVSHNPQLHTESHSPRKLRTESHSPGKLRTESSDTCSEGEEVMTTGRSDGAERAVQLSRRGSTSTADHSVHVVVEFILQYWKEMRVANHKL